MIMLMLVVAAAAVAIFAAGIAGGKFLANGSLIAVAPGRQFSRIFPIKLANRPIKFPVKFAGNLKRYHESNDLKYVLAEIPVKFPILREKLRGFDDGGCLRSGRRVGDRRPRAPPRSVFSAD
jgi:hypothetical protein